MEEKYKIRFAGLSDLEAITNIYNQAIDSMISTGDTNKFFPEDRREWFESFTIDEYPLYVVEIDTGVIAYAYLSPYRKGRPAMKKVAEISFFVDFDYHNRGVGSTLLKHIIEDCKRLKKETLLAFILDVNPESAGLLRKFDFELWAKLPYIVEFDTYKCSHLIYGKSLV